MTEIEEMLREQRERQEVLEARERLAIFTTLANFEARLVIRASAILAVALIYFTFQLGVADPTARWSVVGALILLGSLSVYSYSQWRREVTKARLELKARRNA